MNFRYDFLHFFKFRPSLIFLKNEEEIFKAVKLSAMKGVKPDKKEQRISSLLWILKYINSKQAIIAELMAVKL
jgi:hypothetical protein